MPTEPTPSGSSPAPDAAPPSRWSAALGGGLGEFLRYCVVAGVGLAVDYGALIVAVEVFHAGNVVGAAAGFVCGLLVNFALSERFVFRGPGRGTLATRFAAFAVIGLVGLAILSALMWVLADTLGLNYVVAKTLATAVVYAWNYLARRRLYRPADQRVRPVS